MASIGVTEAWGWRVRKARAARFSTALFAAIILASVFESGDARAQFVCNPSITPGANENVTCMISADIGGPFLTGATGTGNATVVNLPAGIADSITTSAEDGNATTRNFGQVFDYIRTTISGGGNATTFNAGTGIVGGNIFTAANSGTAVTQNAGATDSITTVSVFGNAVTINAGSVPNFFSSSPLPVFPPPGIFTASFVGDATTINTGYVGGGLFGSGIITATGLSGGTGNATTVNYGFVDGEVLTTTGFSLVGPPPVTGSTGNATLINFGTIDTTSARPTGGGYVDIVSYGGAASGYNAGKIIGEVGIFSTTGGSATFSNAGFIDGTYSGAAINLGQIDPVLGVSDPTVPTTLNILPGSRIQGIIGLNGDPFASGSSPTKINIFSGDVSSVTTFGGIGVCGCFYAGLLDTGATVNVIGGSPYVIKDDTVIVLDPTSFAAQDRNVLDFTHTVLSAATSRLNNPAPMSGDGSAAIGFAPSGNVARDMANDAFASIPALSYAGQDRVLRSNPNFTAADGTSVWAQGFGGLRVQQADGPNLRSVNQFYGGILGLDKAVRPNLRLGGFIGAGSVSSDINMNSGSTKSDMAFGGVYGRYAIGRAFLDFALLGGGSSNDVKRTMTNNLVPGGYEFASASYNGWYISPELAYGVRQDIAKNWTATPTLRVRYLAANFGGYQESGSSNNLTVSGRTTHNFEERGEVVFTRTTNEREGSVLQINGTVGLLAWQRAGDTMINTVLLGQNLAFATTGKNNVVGGYAGGGFDWRQTSGVSVFGATEITAMSDSSHTITGRGGVKVAF